MRGILSARWSSTQMIAEVAASVIGPGPVSMTASGCASDGCELGSTLGARLGDGEMLAADRSVPVVPHAASIRYATSAMGNAVTRRFNGLGLLVFGVSLDAKAAGDIDLEGRRRVM